MSIIGTFIRGPGWMWFWPGQTWDHNRLVFEVNRDIYDVGLFSWIPGIHTMLGKLLFGAAVVGAYFVAAGGLVHKVMTLSEFNRKILARMSLLQYLTIQAFATMMLGLPAKMLLRLGFRIKYVWITPWFNILWPGLPRRARVPEPVPQDAPIVSRSLSGPLLLASLLLLGSLAWALYDEFYGLRPWKSYQQRFVTLYATYLKDRIPQRAEEERKIREQAAFQKMEEAMQKAEQAVGPQVEQIDREIRDLDRRISVLTDTFQAARGQVTALVYQAETAGSARARERLLRKIEEAKQGPFRATLPVPDGTVETINFTYDELEKEYSRLKERKAELLGQREEEQVAHPV